MSHLEAPASASQSRLTSDPLVGRWIDGRFLIRARLATGGFGAVYRARTATGERVAIKILHPWLSDDANMVARFRREGQTLLQLHAASTVHTIAVGETADGLLYIAMELLTGESLHDRLRKVGALAWQTAVAIARAVCDSLAEAHALGVVHRDLKPANIQIERGDQVKVIDFGIVKIARGSSIDDGRELTNVGQMIGTCDYMSPEQIVGEACQASSDIYSLGLVLYEMLTGRRAYPQSVGPAAMMAALLTQTIAPPSVHAAIPPALDRVVMRCLQREPEDRYAEIRELARALDAIGASSYARDEVTVVNPVFDGFATLVDDDAKPTVAAAPVADPQVAAVPVATETNAPPDRPSHLPWAMPVFTTLPGVAVASFAPPRRADTSSPLLPAPAAPVTPIGWQVGPVAGPWLPATAAPPPPEQLASGSWRPSQVLARMAAPRATPGSGGALWLALVILCTAAIVVAALVR